MLITLLRNCIFVFSFCILLSDCSSKTDGHTNTKELAKNYYGDDSQWYIDNIPFFECSDKELEAVYYYRWKLYKAHIRNVGQNQFVVTEFINDVHWDIDPYSTIDAASGHHIYEGRWLKDDRYMNSYIDYLNKRGGNNRSYSEWIADAAYARYLVNGDSMFIVDQLDSMKALYNEWSDHWEPSKNLYYIPAMPDATEYTIASIDASGGKDGFEGGVAFRPTFNSYMYGNAIAISKIAALKGDDHVSNEFSEKAHSLQINVEENLWNDSLQHFVDRYKQDNRYVHYWHFIRGRELAGMIPWYFNLPSGDPKYSSAWKHVTDTTALLGKYGFRTNEPSYEYYFKQYVFNDGRRGSQWNGPSWPFQSSLVLTGMANLLNNYDQKAVDVSDYLHLLRLFTRQHYLPNGNINLVENYDPNHGGPIVHFYWSNHYNHSSYNNLIIAGLCGIRPSAGDSLIINPLVDETIDYFSLIDLSYHGHLLTLVYDRTGEHYHSGQGLRVQVDGKDSPTRHGAGNNNVIYVGKSVIHTINNQSQNFSLNIQRKGYPKPAASVNNIIDSLYQAVDGRIWNFSEISNRWTTEGSNSDHNWLAIDFGSTHQISEVHIYPFVDGKRFVLPSELSIEYKLKGEWIRTKTSYDIHLVGNTKNVVLFEKVDATEVRFKFVHPTNDIAIGEIEVY